MMRLMVDGGRSGARRAAEEGQVAVIVDALRASTTTASLLHHGVKTIIVVEHVAQALAEHGRQPGSLLLGERRGLKVEGFDLGNSPLQSSLPSPAETIIFTSSNMSRCCVGAASASAVFLGTLVTLSRCADLALRAAREAGRDIILVPAGAAADESRLILEDYVACGALIGKLAEVSGGEASAEGDAAQAALELHAAARQHGLERTFLETDDGRGLCALGFEADVRFASRVDVLCEVPRLRSTYSLADGGRAVVLARG